MNLLKNIYNHKKYVKDETLFYKNIYNENLYYFKEIIQEVGQTLIPSIENTRWYDTTTKIEYEPNEKFTTIFDVENKDTITCAKKMVDNGYNPCVLNMASEYKAGGGWQDGRCAQEESLFFKSTYALSLDLKIRAKYTNIINEIKNKFNILNIQLDNWFFPVNKSPTSGFYSPHVYIFRDEDYNILPYNKCFYLSFVAVAGLRNPLILQSGKLEPNHALLLKEKMRTILRIGLGNKHDSMTLGLIGAGVFNNPPKHVAELFCEVFEEVEFKNKFRKITFAILNTKISKKQNNNYEICKEVINNYNKLHVFQQQF